MKRKPLSPKRNGKQGKKDEENYIIDCDDESQNEVEIENKIEIEIENNNNNKTQRKTKENAKEKEKEKKKEKEKLVKELNQIYNTKIEIDTSEIEIEISNQSKIVFLPIRNNSTEDFKITIVNKKYGINCKNVNIYSNQSTDLKIDFCCKEIQQEYEIVQIESQLKGIQHPEISFTKSFPLLIVKKKSNKPKNVTLLNLLKNQSSIVIDPSIIQQYQPNQKKQTQKTNKPISLLDEISISESTI